MNRQVEVIGGTAKFFRDGAACTVPEAGTASAANLPGPTDPAWLGLGAVEVKAKPSFSEKEIKDVGSTGHRVRTKIVRFAQTLDFAITCKEMQNLIFEAVFAADKMSDSKTEGATPVTAGGSFVPLENFDGIQGWLSVDYLGRGGQLLNTTVWVDIKANEDFEPGEEPVEYEILARVLHNALNTGTLA